MYLINHFLDTLLLGQPVPDIGALNQTNAVSGTNSLGAQVNTCIATQGRPPNFMLVDVCRRIYSSGNHLMCNSPSIMSLVEAPYLKWQQPSTELHTTLLLQSQLLSQLPDLSFRRHSMGGRS